MLVVGDIAKRCHANRPESYWVSAIFSQDNVAIFVCLGLGLESLRS